MVVEEPGLPQQPHLRVEEPAVPLPEEVESPVLVRSPGVVDVRREKVPEVAVLRQVHQVPVALLEEEREDKERLDASVPRALAAAVQRGGGACGGVGGSANRPGGPDLPRLPSPDPRRPRRALRGGGGAQGSWVGGALTFPFRGAPTVPPPPSPVSTRRTRRRARRPGALGPGGTSRHQGD